MKAGRCVAVAALFLSMLAPDFTDGAAWAQKVTVDSRRHIHYGPLSRPAVFPIVIYDFNANLCDDPANELQLLSQLSVDTVIDVVCDTATSAKNIASAMKPYGLNLWSTVPQGVGYAGNDPGWVKELAALSNVTGYFVDDEPQNSSDIARVNKLNRKIRAIDPTALTVTSFNDAPFGGTFPDYGGGPLREYNGTAITMDVLGNSFWNNSPPRSSNGLYDVTLDTKVWDRVANVTFPKVPLITDIAFYGPAANANCYLTRRQTLSEAWAAVINHTDGIAWWALGQGETAGGPMCDGTNETYTQLWSDLIHETKTVKAVIPVILSPAITWYTHSEPETIVQTAGRSGWIFAANLTQETVRDTFDGLPARSTVTAYAGNPNGSSRRVCTNCGRAFTDTLPGFVAYAYHVTTGHGSAPAPTAKPSARPTAAPTPARTPTPRPTAAPKPTPAPTATPRPIGKSAQFIAMTADAVQQSWQSNAVTLRVPVGARVGGLLLADIVAVGANPGALNAPNGWALMKRLAIAGQVYQWIYAKPYAANDRASFTWSFANANAYTGGEMVATSGRTIDSVVGSVGSSSTITAPAAVIRHDDVAVLFAVDGNGWDVLEAPADMAVALNNGADVVSFRNRRPGVTGKETITGSTGYWAASQLAVMP